MKKRMVFYGIVFFLLLLAVALKFLGWQGEKKFKLRTTETLNELRTAVSGTGKTAYDAKDFEELPPPVKNYLKRAMPEQGLFINRIHLRQKGEIRVHDEASWNNVQRGSVCEHEPGTVSVGRNQRILAHDPPGDYHLLYFWKRENSCLAVGVGECL